jgi:NADH dehydrogenase (ubiquinone) 1 alpha subcomplex subunit 6
MTTTPARLALLSRTSSSPAQARQRAIGLYRQWYRSVCRLPPPPLQLPYHPADSPTTKAPEIVSMYALNVPVSTVRRAIRARFERNRWVTDPRAIDVLLMKSWQEYQETMNLWKMPDHVMGLFLGEDTRHAQGRERRTFLEKFYEGAFVCQKILFPRLIVVRS